MIVMTLDEAREFIASVSWRAVRTDIKYLGEVDPNTKDWGYKGTYRAPYRPDYVMSNVYLELDGYCYWRIGASMMNRELAENRSSWSTASTSASKQMSSSQTTWPPTKRKFTELYNVQVLRSNQIDPAANWR